MKKAKWRTVADTRLSVEPNKGLIFWRGRFALQTRDGIAHHNTPSATKVDSVSYERHVM
jgi:hypothetical protein